jgi:hypothetical protein
MSTVEASPGRGFYDLATLSQDDGDLARVRELAALRLRDADPGNATLMGIALNAWSPAQVKQCLAEALTFDPFALMAQAWEQVAGVRDARERSIGPPATSQGWALLKHDIEARIQPRLVLSIRGVDWCDLELEVELVLAIESAELEFVEGHLRAVKLGKAKGRATVSCNGAPLPSLERELKFKAAYRVAAPMAEFDPDR